MVHLSVNEVPPCTPVVSSHHVSPRCVSKDTMNSTRNKPPFEQRVRGDSNLGANKFYQGTWLLERGWWWIEVAVPNRIACPVPRDAAPGHARSRLANPASPCRSRSGEVACVWFEVKVEWVGASQSPWYFGITPSPKITPVFTPPLLDSQSNTIENVAVWFHHSLYIQPNAQDLVP
jgi:hypothetical protein